MRRYKWLLCVLLLAGCAVEPLHVPAHTGKVAGWHRWSEPPKVVQLTWERVGFFEMQRVCGGVGPLDVRKGETMRGCAAVAPDRSRCTIYTLEHVYPETLGHEVAHCFIGDFHR